MQKIRLNFLCRCAILPSLLGTEEENRHEERIRSCLDARFGRRLPRDGTRAGGRWREARGRKEGEEEGIEERGQRRGGEGRDPRTGSGRESRQEVQEEVQ